MNTRTTEKLLRVAVLRQGRLSEERLVRRGEDVTIGSSPRSTFVVDHPELGRKVRLLRGRRQGGWSLRLGGPLEGRVAVDGEVLTLDGAAERRDLTRGWWRKRLWLGQEDFRGSVAIGDVFVLFQLVDAPRTLVAPSLAAEVRRRPERHGAELVFLNLLIILGLVMGGSGLGLDVWWRHSGRFLDVQIDRRDNRAYQLLKSRLEFRDLEEPEPIEVPPAPDVDVAVLEPEPEPTKAEPTKLEPTKLEPIEAPPAKAEERPEKSRKAEPKPVRTPRDPKPKLPKRPTKVVADASSSSTGKRSPKEIRSSVEDKTWLHALKSADDGDGEAGRATLGAGLVTSDLDKAFASLDGGVAMADDAAGTKTFVGAPRTVKSSKPGLKSLDADDVGGGKIATNTVKSENKDELHVADPKETPIATKVKTQSGKQTGLGKVDAGAVQRVFAKRRKAIKHCYEKALRSDASLAGKVAIKFTVGTEGRVVSIKVTKNTTGASSIGQCIQAKVKTWKFPVPVGGSVTFSNQFVFDKG